MKIYERSGKVGKSWTILKGEILGTFANVHERSTSQLMEDQYCMWYKYKYTKNLRKELYSSLERRFSDLLVDNDIFILSTLLDPIFGKRRIPLELRDYAIVKIIWSKYQLVLSHL